MNHADTLHLEVQQAKAARQAAADNYRAKVHKALIDSMLHAFEVGNGAQVIPTAGFDEAGRVNKKYTLAEFLAEECSAETCGKLVALIGACMRLESVSPQEPAYLVRERLVGVYSMAAEFACDMAQGYADFHADDEAAK